jgi:hypothetical protein
MILSKAGKLTLLAGLLCLLLMGFTGASYGQVRSIRWDVFPSPTEVITTGRSEVLGSISFYVQIGQGPVVTGNALGGPTQIGITYGQGVQIDSTYGVRVYAPKFASSTGVAVVLQNLNIIPTPTRCSGFLTLNIPAGVTLVDGDVIRVDGVRGRIDMSDGRNAGTNLTAQMQSINDPSANMFFPETVRVATSYPGMVVTNVVSDVATLCLLPYGKDANATLTNYIEITEGFVRAFVAKDSNATGADLTDRLDSGGEILGQSSYSTSTSSNWATRAVGTRIQVVMNSIPASITAITWPTTVYNTSDGAHSYLALVTGTTSFTAGTPNVAANGSAYATYEYFAYDQAGWSDTNLEKFRVQPLLTISGFNQSDVGSVLIAASLTGASETYSGCEAPHSTTRVQPRFIIVYQSYKNGAATPETTDRLSTTFGVYAQFSPCVCYLLYPYITADKGITMPAGTLNWDTGISVSNTSDDAAVFGTLLGAARQSGNITFYLYDANYGYVGAPVTTSGVVGFGKGYVTLATMILSQIAQLPDYPAPGVNSFPYVSNGGFHGYMIVKANFQYCHGYAFVADINFSTIAQGYVANVIPDPAVKGKRSASAAGDITNKPAGESLNN